MNYWKSASMSFCTHWNSAPDGLAVEPQKLNAKTGYKYWIYNTNIPKNKILIFELTKSLIPSEYVNFFILYESSLKLSRTLIIFYLFNIISTHRGIGCIS